MPDSAGTAVQEVLQSGYISEGSEVASFARRFTRFLGVERTIPVSSASAALTLALQLIGIAPGDEIICSPMCCTASTMPILTLRALPVWCDVNPNTGMLDPSSVTQMISGKTRAILLYHWAGDVADIAALRNVADQHGLSLIADASEALGAEIDGRRIGACGCDFVAFSFGAVKHITTLEGGALVCISRDDSDRAVKLKRFGIDQTTFRTLDGEINPESDIPEAGYCAYMTNVPAAIGSVQMAGIDSIITKYRTNGLFYDDYLRDIAGLHPLNRLAGSVSAYWTYALRAERRDDLSRYLRENGVGSSRLHVRNDTYSCFPPPRCELPGVDAFDLSTLSIPSGWWIGSKEREYIADLIRKGW